MAYTEDIHKTGNDLMRSLNRLKWLHAFEATARHGSFTGAAQELGVTPAAVGQLVRALEDWVGHPLLHRTRWVKSVSRWSAKHRTRCAR